MFQKVLIAEDHDSTNIGVKIAIEELNIHHAEFAKHCDEAFLKIKRAIHDQKPFDLLITDLSFDPVAETETLKSGQELIGKIKEEKIKLSVLVFSSENKPLVIKKLFDQFDINGFVSKSRFDSRDLRKAIEKIYSGEKYMTSEIKRGIHLQKNNYILDDVDFQLMKLLCKGYSQDEISLQFIEDKIVPSSKSSIEKKLKILREEFQAKTNIELVIILQGLGLLNE